MMLGLAMLNYYFELVKPRQTLLLLVTMYGAYFAAGGRDLATLLWMSIAGFLSIAGTTAMNMVLERDIDSLMPRTASRPIPAGLVKPASAASFSVATYTLGALVGTMVNPVFTLTILLGYFFDILIYTNLVKRSTPLNIVLGGVAGGMPALGGWAAARGAIELGGSLLSLLVMAWIPMHIWFIATYFLEDYRKAGVPMAPVVLGPVRAAYLTEASTIIMIVISWLFVVLEGYGLLAAITALILGALSVKNIRAFRRKPTREHAYSMFKFASPLLASIFTVLALEAQLGFI